MFIEITGRIIEQIDEKYGRSLSGKEWHKKVFLLQLNEGSRFEHSIVFSMTSFDGNIQDPPKPNELVKLGLQITAHQYNGKWFNDIQATKCERVK